MEPLEHFGILVMDHQGYKRSSKEIMEDIIKIWDNLDQEEKLCLLTHIIVIVKEREKYGRNIY